MLDFNQKAAICQHLTLSSLCYGPQPNRNLKMVHVVFSFSNKFSQVTGDYHSSIHNGYNLVKSVKVVMDSLESIEAITKCGIKQWRQSKSTNTNSMMETPPMVSLAQGHHHDLLAFEPYKLLSKKARKQEGRRLSL
jgi:hypothetical protein